jgi:RimJ/RimL family protein N-acetyltransferase
VDSARTDSTIAVRRLTADDVAAYRDMMLAAYALHPEAFTSTPEERAALPLSWWEARSGLSEDASEFVFGAFVDGTLVGAAGLSFETRCRTRHKATLFGMYVDASQRGRGLGQALVAAVLEFARRRPQVNLVQLTVSEDNAQAVQLYRQCGFVPYGLEPRAVMLSEGYIAKIHMWHDLAEET